MIDSPSLFECAIQALKAINEFEACSFNATPEILAKDKFRLLALERSFEIICSSLRYIPDSLKAREPEINWQRMADLDNRLRDQYYCNNTTDLLEITKRNLPPLKVFAERVIDQLE